jgi:nucleotide-binding universal stress UspA family protein
MHEKIVLPLDGSKIGETAIPYVKGMLSKFSPRVKVEILLLQVISPWSFPRGAGAAGVDIPYTEQELEYKKAEALDYLNKVGETLKTPRVTIKARAEIGNAAEEIVKAAEEIEANLIAMSTHGRSGITKWVFGSVTDRVLRREGRIPIVMVRAPKK